MLAVTAVAEAAAVIEAADLVVGVNGACWAPLVFSAAPLFGSAALHFPVLSWSVGLHCLVCYKKIKTKQLKK